MTFVELFDDSKLVGVPDLESSLTTRHDGRPVTEDQAYCNR